MGLMETVFLGFALLLSGGGLLSAAQSQFSFVANETLNQTSAESLTTTPQLPAELQWSGVQPGDLAAAGFSYRLRSPQLRSLAGGAGKPKQVQSLQRPEEGGALTLEQLELGAGELLGPETELHREPSPKVLLEQRVPADSVSVQCGEAGVTVEVNRNFLGNGQLIRPSDLTLGGCPAVGAAGHALQFQAELQDCGSTVEMTEEAVIYAFTLKYSPTPIGGTFILKTSPAEVGVRCRYPRKHRVSSGGARPTWNQFSSNVRAQQQLHFSLHLMTDDWRSPRPSGAHFLSDVMHMEASVLQGRHRPLRVFVDSCVATPTPNPYSQPRYSFVSNHGCLMDAKLTGAKSYFMQRSQEDKLQFQLKAFRFHHDDRKSLHITCQLRATLVSVPIDSQHKACSYLTEAKRWVASGGDNKVCSCCESSCREQRLRRSLAADAASLWEGTAALGPVLLEERILQAELSQLQTSEVTQAAWDSSAALLGGVGAALAVVLIAFTGAVILSSPHKPAEYSVHT